MMEIMNYIKPELLLLIPVCWVIGAALKHSEAIKDKFIPLALGACGVLLAALWVLATSDITGYQDALMAVFVAVVQGVLCAGVSVYGNQLWKQGGKVE